MNNARICRPAPSQSCGDGECDAGAGDDELTCGADCGPFAGACLGACSAYVEAADCWCDAG